MTVVGLSELLWFNWVDMVDCEHRWAGGYCMGGHLEEGGGSVCAEYRLKRRLGEQTSEGGKTS